MALFRKKIAKTIFVVLSGLILIAMGGFALMYFEAQSYLNKNLSEFVEKKSKGKYELTFDNLEINFKLWGFEINQVSIHPSDSIRKVLEQDKTNQRFYSFSSPTVRIGGIRLMPLVFRKKLEIGDILISQPELNIRGKETGQDDKKINIITLFQELKPLVTKTFKSIKIGKIELSNASFDFYSLLGDARKLSNAENITIGILNYYTDSVILKDPNRLFLADDVYLRMQNFQNKLADSIHSISAGFITYSLKHSRIEATNLELKPVKDALSMKSQYQVSIEKAKITSNQIKDFYQNNFIPIDSMILTNAKIKYWPGQKQVKTKSEPLDEFNLYELIKKEFSGVRIKNFKLNNTQLTLFKTQGDTESQQNLKNIDLKLEDVLLDSISSKDTSRILYSKNIDLSATDYQLTLGDNIHCASAGYLSLSTGKKSVIVKNIQIFPRKTSANKANPRNTIEAKCDSVRLDRFNIKKAYHQKRFLFQQISIFNPEVRLTQNELSVEKSIPEPSLPEQPSFIYHLISNYAKGIYSNQVLVQKGKIQLINKTGLLQKGYIESTLKLQLSGFELDENSAKRTDRLFFANQIELNFSNYQMQLVDKLHKLTIENLSVSTRQKKALLQNLHLFPVKTENMEDLLKQYNLSALYEFTIPELIIANADFHETFFNKKLTADSLTIKKPQLYYENFALLKLSKPKVEFEDLFKLLADYLDNIQIGRVEIPDGTIRLINHNLKGKTISLDNNFSLKLENTLVNKDQFDQKRLLFSQFVDFSVRNHLIHLADNVHVLKAAEAGFSTKRKEVYAINARLYPETNSADFPSIIWNIQLNVPEIRIKGINIEEFYFEHKIEADNLLIKSPEIKLYQKQKKTGANDLKDLTFLLPKEIESIEIRKFNLNNGSIKIFSEMEVKPYLLIESDMNLAAQNILIQKSADAGKAEFKTGDYMGKLLQFNFKPKDKNQEFFIDELSFSTIDRRIIASNLSALRKTKNLSQNQFDLTIPKLSMNGLNLGKAHQDNQFFFESVVIEKPIFKLYNNDKDSAKFNPFKVNLYPHLERFANIFDSKILSIKDADFIVFRNEQEKISEKISINLSDVRIDNNPSQGFLHALDFSFSVPNLKRQGKLYQFTVGETSYSSKNDRLLARDIRIIPNFSLEKHQKQTGFQTDYFHGKIDSAFIEKPDLRQWFDHEKLIGKYLGISGLNLDIYRDKRLPFDEKRRPPMLQDLIKSLKYPVSVDSLRLENAKFSYTEQPASGESEGKIGFTKVGVRLMPFTNIKNSKGAIPDFSLVGSATILDSCHLKVNMNYQMNNPKNLFTVNGSINRFNMRILNPVLEPLVLVSIRSGVVDRFQFSISADKTRATGNLFFGYNDLRISVLETKNGNTKEAKFASFLANSWVLKTKNPKGKEFLPEEINFMRDEKRSVVNYWWKSVFSGIRNTLGIKENKPENQQ